MVAVLRKFFYCFQIVEALSSLEASTQALEISLCVVHDDTLP